MLMHRGFELDASELKTLPRYQLAARHERLVKKILVVCLVLSVCLIVVLRLQLFPSLAAVLVLQAAALLVLSASLQSLWWVTRWRMRALKAETRAAEPESCETQTEPNSPSAGRFSRLFKPLALRWQRLLVAIRRRGDALNNLATSLLSGLAFTLIFSYWNTPPSTTATPSIGQVSVALLMVIGLVSAAFAALVLERHFVHLSGGETLSPRAKVLPEAPHLVYQLRVYITLSLLATGALLLATEARQWPLTAVVWLGVLPAAIAVEFLLRAALSVFAPPRQQEPELLTESFLAAAWRWPIKPFGHLQDELKQRFGIDLRQSWAFAYIRRSLLPVVGVLLGIAWLFSGLVEIPMAERGIYERFGAPVAVWQPGIHLGLPWPMGRVQAMENGVVHELSATAGEPVKDADTPNASAEGEPPASANRLWDASHLAEKSQIIASEVSTREGKRQSFHIVNMDVRFMYRIGLSDSAALKARYTSADAPALIRSTANRILVRYFAARTLEGVLGEARTQMAKEIGAQLQTDLNNLNSGVEIMSTVLEAIHPPAAAANAYHAVQAAQIKAQAIIARERGSAAQAVSVAQVRALIARNQASASAREATATAEAAHRRFSAERDAYQQGGKAFLLEQYFTQLTQGLGSAQLLVVDHRLPNTAATLDLRDFSSLDKSANRTLSPALAPTVDY